MGEIADDMMDGTICSDCAVFLGEPVGYPRYCNSCHAYVKKPSYSPSQRRRRKTLKSTPPPPIGRKLTPEERREKNWRKRLRNKANRAKRKQEQPHE